MSTVESLQELADAHFAAKHDARERSLARTRQLVRASGNAIRAVHRREFQRARALLLDASHEVAAIKVELADLPELYHHNYVVDTVKEFAEAHLTLAIVCGEAWPMPDDLGIGYVAYYNGLAEAVGELRRFTLDALRRDDVETAERLLQSMDDIYEVLVTIDYPDAVTGSLRRSTDVARAILEKTRGDLTTAMRQHRLERALDAARPDAAQA